MSASPRVTFILLAFRQEQLVEESVRSVFAQDYPNLEIILSDDNSPDGTLQTLERLAADYAGPHDVVVNRSPGGRGLLAHIYHAWAKSSGELIVVGAGDDISYPHRVSRLVEEWQRTGADALYSSFHRIGPDGLRLSDEPFLPRADYDPSQYFDGGAVHQIAGASSAYARGVFEAVRLPVEPVFAEDFFLSLMLGWRNRPVALVEESLLAYRVHAGAMSSAGEDLLGVAEYEASSARAAERTGQALRIFERYLRTDDGVDPSFGSPRKVRRDKLGSDLDFLDYRARWITLPFRRRLAAAVRFREGRQQRWLLPRLFGVDLLARLKRR